MKSVDKFFRQRGIIDQAKLEDLRVFLSGSPDGIAELIVLLRQLGVGEGSGVIGFHDNFSSINTVFWKLMYPELKTLQSASESARAVFKSLADGEFDPLAWDIHLDLNGATPDSSADLYGRVEGPRAFVSTQIISQVRNSSEAHPLSSAMRTATAAAMVERMLIQCQVAHAITVSDAWYTLTCRIETTDSEEAKELVQGLKGEVLTLQPTSDGLATLARYRLRASSPESPFSHLEIARTKPQNKPWALDVGIIEWSATFGTVEVPWKPRIDDAVILGTGGLGSWAAPLLAEQLNTGNIHLIDGDESIELHNLNRQVLYQEQHIGLPKTNVAVEQLQRINPRVQFIGYKEYLLPHHLVVDENENIDSFDLEEEPSENQLYDPLSKGQLYLACLDNMRTRTLLNEAAIDFNAVMINGAGEGLSGVVERFHGNDGCMVCRYGAETAYALEVVSCTEEGKRPIASIVTTTAWVGAMMAAYALIEAAGPKSTQPDRIEWNRGAVSRIPVAAKPPWFHDRCSSHI